MTPWKGNFIEILRVQNGFAVYDFSVAGYQSGMDGRRPMPIAVFESKESLLKWLSESWEDVYISPFGE